jgi:hypothetical protein
MPITIARLQQQHTTRERTMRRWLARKIMGAGLTAASLSIATAAPVACGFSIAHTSERWSVLLL